MPEISGMVLDGQDAATRVQNVIDSATWIAPADEGLVEQGKQQILDQISNDGWVAPFIWRIAWINVPAQEAQQDLQTEIASASGIA